MMSELAHHTQNSTLEECFMWILNHTRDVESLKATNCLDFLAAMLSNPRLWQVRGLIIILNFCRVINWLKKPGTENYLMKLRVLINGAVGSWCTLDFQIF